MLTGYTFFVDDGVTETQVYPRNPNLVWSDAPDDNNGFYRRKLNTTVIFSGDDYTLLKTEDDANDCTVWDFVVKYETVEVFRGYMRFDTSAFSWDISNCRVQVRIDPQDDYTCFLRAWEDEINILDGTTKRTVNTVIGTIETIECSESYTAGVLQPEDYPTPITDCITPGEGWVQIDQLVNTGGGNDTVFSTYIREVYTSTCSGGVPVPPPGDGWILIADNCPTDADYARPVPVTDLVVATELSAGELYRATAEVRGGLTFDGTDYNNTPLPNGVLLSDALTNFAPCSLSVVSDYFDINPDDTHPANDAYTWAASNATDIIIFQKSDVKRPDAFIKATNGKWSFQGLLNALRAQFNVRYRVSGSTLRIEHVSYWAAVNGENFLTDQPERLAGKHRYEIDDAKTPKLEKWQFMETVTPAFAGVPITYTCFGEENNGEQTYAIERTNNDIGYIMAVPDSATDDGFVFACCYLTGGNYYLITSENPIDNELYLNGSFSIPNLLEAAHTWDRPLPEGTMNNTLTSFDSFYRRKKQTEIIVIMSATDYFNWDASELVNTQLGYGEIEQAQYDAATCRLTINTRHT